MKAKAKRRLRKSSSRDSTRESLSEPSSIEPGTDPHSPKGKINTNDRKSRTGKGRGLPKKGLQDTIYATVVPELEEGELEKTVNPIVQEYFEHGDTKEVEMLLKELNLGPHRYEFSSLAVSLALEGKASHRELTSRLLSDLSGKMLSGNEMERAFDKILKELPDLILDTPEAPQMLGQFMARAIADHVLPMSFFNRYKGKVDCDYARAALDRASVLLSMKKEIVRLDNVWGVGGGQRPVKHLIKEMNLLLKEYLVSGDVSEAEHCLRDLEVPHFHHELVYEAIVMVLESKGDKAIQMMVNLLKVFWQTGLITLDQMNRGFQRVYDELPEINLDVPHAHSIMESFVDVCFQESVITKQLRDACPSRGRKRFVSEGDGGMIKS
uniref:MI domain-containing protein n=1 Tax=Denticeps clupeoides TaxID=299321 RepID=A0AAY3ZZE8_9TELE